MISRITAAFNMLGAMSFSSHVLMLCFRASGRVPRGRCMCVKWPQNFVSITFNHLRNIIIHDNYVYCSLSLNTDISLSLSLSIPTSLSLSLPLNTDISLSLSLSPSLSLSIPTSLSLSLPLSLSQYRHLSLSQYRHLLSLLVTFSYSSLLSSHRND